MAGKISLAELDNTQEPPSNLLQLAMQAHQAGDLDKAEELYRQAAMQPQFCDTANLYLAITCLQRKRYAESCAIFQGLEGTSADGAMLQVNYGMALMESGQTAQALPHLSRGVDLDPQSNDAHFNLGRCLNVLERYAEAKEQFQIVVSANPNDAQAWCMYGGVLSALNENNEALGALEKAFNLSGESALIRLYSGQAWENLQAYTEAAANYQRSLEMNPGEIRCLLGLARTLARTGNYEQALEYCANAEENFPDHPAILTTFSAIYLMKGDFKQGTSYAKRSVEKDADSAEACGLLAYGLSKSGEAEEAEKWFAQACNLAPHNPQHQLNRSTNFAARGMPQLALEAAYTALSLDPQNPSAYSNVLLYLHYPDNSDQNDIFSLHQKWGQLFSITPQQPFTFETDANKLRIGFLSGDLRRHSVAFFVRPLLKELQARGVECVIYSNNPSDDSITEDLKKYCTEWYDIRHVDDMSAIEAIVSHKLSALIELNGHTDNNRLQLFSCKPAPLCISWLGYPDTTGIDGTFRITDAVADPQGEEAFYTEELLRMPDCFLCYEAPEVDMVITEREMDAPVVFGSFNNISKISDSCIRCWAEILQNVPESTLILKSRGLEDAQAGQRLIDLFVEEGIDSDRLTFYPVVGSYAEHMAFYNKIDIALDTFPYNGTTTSCEALWMGRPVITYIGKHHRSRVGASILQACGLNEFTGSDASDYIQKCIELAANRQTLADYQRNIREKVKTSALCNASEFSAHFISLIRKSLDQRFSAS